MAETAAITYKGITLSGADLNSIQGWWTGNLIGFYQKYIEEKMLRPCPDTRGELVLPSIASLLAQTKDPREIQDAFPNLRSRSHIFVPVNEHTGLSQGGGGHWSLLVISVGYGVALHYDTVGDHNIAPAKEMVAKIGVLLGKTLAFKEMDDTPRQANGEDCGPLACLVMKCLMERLLKTENTDGVEVNVDEENFNILVPGLRGEVSQLLKQLGEGHEI